MKTWCLGTIAISNSTEYIKFTSKSVTNKIIRNIKARVTPNGAITTQKLLFTLTQLRTALKALSAFFWMECNTPQGLLERNCSNDISLAYALRRNQWIFEQSGFYTFKFTCLFYFHWKSFILGQSCPIDVIKAKEDRTDYYSEKWMMDLTNMKSSLPLFLYPF